MADINSYSRRPRKAIWLQIDEYNSLMSAKNIFEKKIGPAQWGTFIAFLAGVYMGNIELTNALKRDESDNGKIISKE